MRTVHIVIFVISFWATPVYQSDKNQTKRKCFCHAAAGLAQLYATVNHRVDSKCNARKLHRISSYSNRMRARQRLLWLGLLSSVPPMPPIAYNPDSALGAATHYRITIHAAAALPRLKQRANKDCGSNLFECTFIFVLHVLRSVLQGNRNWPSAKCFFFCSSICNSAHQVLLVYFFLVHAMEQPSMECHGCAHHSVTWNVRNALGNCQLLW